MFLMVSIESKLDVVFANKIIAPPVWILTKN